MKDLLVLFPSYGAPEYDTQKLLDELMKSGATVMESHGLGLIDRVRSELASRALETEHEWWLWLDADMAAPPGEIQSLVDSARRSTADLLLAPYQTKERPSVPALVYDHEHPEWPTRERREVVHGRYGYLYPIRRCGFGATMTRRSLFERVAATLPEVDLRGCKRAWPFFLPMLQGRSYLGEDYSFCERALAVGARMFADSRIRVGHVGRYVYTWEDASPREVSPSVILEL